MNSIVDYQPFSVFRYTYEHSERSVEIIDYLMLENDGEHVRCTCRMNSQIPLQELHELDEYYVVHDDERQLLRLEVYARLNINSVDELMPCSYEWNQQLLRSIKTFEILSRFQGLNKDIIRYCMFPLLFPQWFLVNIEHYTSTPDFYADISSVANDQVVWICCKYFIDVQGNHLREFVTDEIKVDICGYTFNEFYLDKSDVNHPTIRKYEELYSHFNFALVSKRDHSVCYMDTPLIKLEHLETSLGIRAKTFL
jgi:hypothetical protein